MFGEYSVFILPSYGVSLIVMAELVVWIRSSWRRYRAELAELEARGIRRQSAVR